MTYPVAKKSLGQNFLVDPTLRRRIAQAIAPKPGETVIEIGPGTGALTAELLALGATVVAVEKDHRMMDGLAQLGAAHPGRLTVHEADALDVNFATLVPNGPVVLAGNLPYNIGTQIVINALDTPNAFTRLVFLLQKEVVGRLCANPADDDWGRLAVLTSLLCERADLFDVPPGAFRPVPKVMSSVVRLTPLPQPRFQVDRAKLEKVTAQAFGQRRKMLRASLKGLIDEAVLNSAGIDPTRRPETLSLAEFVALARLI